MIAKMAVGSSPAALLAAVALLAGSPGRAMAASPPFKLVQSSQIGKEVNETTHGNVCTQEEIEKSGVKCQPGKRSGEPGTFTYPEGVATTATGNFYVADQGNHRVQELEADGKFVLMFGKEVNETTHGNVCTQEEIEKFGVKCASGKVGAEPGEFSVPPSVTVDPVSGNVFVAEMTEATGAARVQEFTASGRFVLEIGNEVNETTKANLCTQEEIEKTAVTCGSAHETTPAQKSEHGVFSFEQGRSNALAIGGEHDLLYVGEAGRVQEFETDGQWKGEIPLSAVPTVGIAVDNIGDIYVAHAGHANVYELNPEGAELGSLLIPPRKEGSAVLVVGIAVDSSGHIAVDAYEEGKQFGSLYDSIGGPRLPGFAVVGDVDVEGMSFGPKGELLAAGTSGQEILSYEPLPVAELRTGAATCAEGAESKTSVTFECQLNGEVNPYGVANTEVWFEWQRTCAFGSETPKEEVEAVEALLPVGAAIAGLRPKEGFCYQLAGTDQNVRSPEQLAGEPPVRFETSAVAPRIVGVPSAAFVKSSSAVLHGELNPENSSTEYFFEYAPEIEPGEKTLVTCPGIGQGSCPGVLSTPVDRSPVYGATGVAIEANDLQPGTTYQYRLAARNEAGNTHGNGAEQEAAFKTTRSPKVQAETGPASEATTTSAVVTGTVNPDGQPATYTFQLGLYKGDATQFGTVLSGATGSSTETKSLVLTGLQPGTEYAYRIEIASGYGTAIGATGVFKTEGIPEALVAPNALPQLPVPSLIHHLPPTCRHGYVLNKKNKCVKIKRPKKRKAHSKKK